MLYCRHLVAKKLLRSACARSPGVREGEHLGSCQPLLSTQLRFRSGLLGMDMWGRGLNGLGLVVSSFWLLSSGSIYVWHIYIYVCVTLLILIVTPYYICIIISHN